MERNYLPLNSCRRDRLVAIVEDVNKTDPLLRDLAPGTADYRGGRGGTNDYRPTGSASVTSTTEPAPPIASIVSIGK